MLCSIDDYFLADGTLAGGYALTNFSLRVTRIFDMVIPIGEISPVFFDRNKRRTGITFNVQRVQDSIKAAENFINIHEATVPRTGDIKFYVSNGTVALIVNADLISHELIREIGSFTEHSYAIVGSTISAPDVGSAITTEGGDHITTESGDTLVIE